VSFAGGLLKASLVAPHVVAHVFIVALAGSPLGFMPCASTRDPYHGRQWPHRAEAHGGNRGGRSRRLRRVVSTTQLERAQKLRLRRAN
jgi:hypothetical protein